MIAVAARAANSLDQQKFDALSLDLDAVRQSIDRIATSIAAGQEQMTRSIDGIAARLQQMTRSFDQLAADQEQMTREITKLQAVEQYVLYKNSTFPAAGPCASTQPRSAAVAGTDGALTATSDRQGRRSSPIGEPMVEDPRPPPATGPCAWSAN